MSLVVNLWHVYRSRLFVTAEDSERFTLTEPLDAIFSEAPLEAFIQIKGDSNINSLGLSAQKKLGRRE